MKGFVSFISGLIFAIGLIISGMTSPEVVRGFLDITGNWNPSLMGVMMGAISVHMLAYRLIKKKKSPLLDTHFHLPTKKDLDAKLIIGSAIFGIGWGWAGICPGPGIVNLATGDLRIIAFVFAMLTGIYLFQKIEKFFI